MSEKIKISELPLFWQLKIKGQMNYGRTPPRCPYDGKDLKDGKCWICGRHYV